MRFTPNQLNELMAGGKIRSWKDVGKTPQPMAKPKKKSKYNNVVVEWNGIKFDSKRELKKYQGLLLKEKAGRICNIRLQVPYELNEGGTHSYKYVADFVYTDLEKNCEVVADAKGTRTAEYKKKKRLMKKVYGIDILEL